MVDGTEGLNVKPSPLGILFKSDYKYIIPIFQRKYEWNVNGKDSQVETLWDDIYGVAEENEKKTHFVGSIVTMSTGKQNESSIIDGQQRMITFTLLIRALMDFVNDEDVTVPRDIYNILEDNPSSEDEPIVNMKRKLRNLIVFQDKPRIERTTGNLGRYREIMTSTEIYPGNYYREEKCYQTFRDYIQEVKDNEDKDPIAAKESGLTVDNLVYTVLKKITIVKISMDNEENASFVFNSLNSTGLKLTPISMIRNYIMLKCSNEEQKTVYDDLWKPFEESLETENSKQIDEGKLADYVRTYLMMELGKPILKNDLYKEAKNFIDELLKTRKTQEAIKQFLSPLIKYANNYKIASGFIDFPATSNNDSRKVRNYLKTISACGFKTHRCYVLSLLNNYDLIKDCDKSALSNLEYLLRILESFIVRRTLQQNMLNNTIDGKFIKYSRENVFSPKQLFEKLREIPQNDAGYCPDDAMLRNSLERKDFYGDGRAALCRTIFWRLEIDLRKNPNFTINDNAGIEHIFPQDEEKYWKREYKEDRDVFDQLKENVHKLGNLTLLDDVENSSIKNKAYRIKYKTYQDSSYRITKEYLPNIDHWKIGDYDKHRDDMISLILKTWSWNFKPKK